MSTVSGAEAGEKREVELLRQAGLRLTPQRLAIARAVLQARHPTVGEVFATVQHQFPTIAVTTVYATLSTMTEKGLVRALPYSPAVRYDANVRLHANLVCTECGGITDLEECEDIVTQLRERADQATGFRLRQEWVDLYGICGECQAARRGR